MTNEERELIERFVARVGGQGQAGGFGSVPATRPTLPPVDPEADSFIKENFQKVPEAPYRITQMAVVQEAALTEAQNRIKRLEWELQQAQAQLQGQGAQSSGQQRQGGGFFSNLFGGGGNNQTQAPPPRWGGQPAGAPGYGPQAGYGQAGYGAPPPAAYPPGAPAPGMFQRQGSGFLGSALTTAAGVAGGMVAGEALMNMFEGHHGGGLGGDDSFGAAGGGETIINNNYGDAAGTGGDPFGSAGGDIDPNFNNGGDSFGDSGGDFGGGGGGWDDDNSF